MQVQQHSSTKVQCCGKTENLRKKVQKIKKKSKNERKISKKSTNLYWFLNLIVLFGCFIYFEEADIVRIFWDKSGWKITAEGTLLLVFGTFKNIRAEFGRIWAAIFELEKAKRTRLSQHVFLVKNPKI